MARSARGFDAEHELTGARRKIVPAVPARGSDAEDELTGARRKIVPAVPARSFEKRKTGDCWPENG